MANRFYIASISPLGDQIIIQDKKIIHQLIKVLRLKKNDIFSVFSQNQEYDLIIKDIQNGQVITTILETKTTNREPARLISLYLSLLKKDKFEWALQKATELGVSTFIPIISNNSIVRAISDQKQKRYQKIIKEATEQCGGPRPAELKPALIYEQAIEFAAKQPGHKLIAWEGAKNNNLSKKIDSNSSYHLFIGPEGGFTAQEIELANKKNITTISLGNRILRAETAAIAAVSLILLS